MSSQVLPTPLLPQPDRVAFKQSITDMRNVSNRHFDELEKFGNIPAVSNQDIMNLLTEMNKNIDQITTKIGDLSEEMKARCVPKMNC